MLNDYMIRADINEERGDNPFYADDHKIDADNSMNGATLGLELANLTDDLEKTFLGYVSATSDLDITDAAAPFVGCGFYRKERFKGAITYKCYWFYKVQFTKESDSTNTKGESTEFQTESISGDVMGVSLTSAGNVIYYTTSRKDSETNAINWLKTKAGIS